MRRDLVSPLFVGRETELATLTAALESAVAGEPTVVLLGGEAGVGKTRLVAEAAERAAGRCARARGQLHRARRRGPAVRPARGRAPHVDARHAAGRARRAARARAPGARARCCPSSIPTPR